LARKVKTKETLRGNLAFLRRAANRNQRTLPPELWLRPAEGLDGVHSMKGWLFTRFSDGWRWHDFTDEARPRRSANAFPSLLECVNDATRNGYSPKLNLAVHLDGRLRNYFTALS
jgi:hypothetical protein